MHDIGFTTQAANTRPRSVPPQRSGQPCGKLTLGMDNAFRNSNRQVAGFQAKGKDRQRKVFTNTEGLKEMLEGNSRTGELADHDRSIKGNSQSPVTLKTCRRLHVARLRA